MCVETATDFGDCDVHVSCDSSECTALKQPRTLEDYIEAYEHWKDHSWTRGCSHGS